VILCERLRRASSRQRRVRGPLYLYGMLSVLAVPLLSNVLPRADLSYADLSRADLSHADLSNANADLSYANLTSSSLLGANLSHATRFRTRFCSTLLPDGERDNNNC
jgi:uncharacterized protein YjbI with pentapeptide repeats